MEQINGPIVFHISASLEQGRKRDIVQDSKSRVTEGRERRESGRREKMLHKVWFSFPNIFVIFFLVTFGVFIHFYLFLYKSDHVLTTGPFSPLSIFLYLPFQPFSFTLSTPSLFQSRFLPLSSCTLIPPCYFFFPRRILGL